MPDPKLRDHGNGRRSSVPQGAAGGLLVVACQGEFKERLRYAVGIVAQDVAFVDEVAGNRFDAEFANTTCYAVAVLI